MTIKELEHHLNQDAQFYVGHMDIEGWSIQELEDYHDWLSEQYRELHKYDNISLEHAWDLA